jgi:RND family efflux transporter MFP subunit
MRPPAPWLPLAALGLLMAAPAAAGGEGAEVVTVTARPMPVTVTAYGVIHPGAESVLAAKVSARVDALPLREGQAVAKGALVVRLDPRDIQAELAAAVAGQDRAKSTLAEAETENTRVQALLAAGSATTRDRDRAEAALSQAQAAANEAAAGVEQAETQLAHTRVTAPFAGRLVERRVEVGELASPGTPLVRVESEGGFQLWADVAQGDLRHVRTGADAVVYVDGVDRPLPGQVGRVIPAADPRSHTFTVKVSLETPQTLDTAGTGGDFGNAGVYTGMFGRVEIVRGEENVLTVPRSAIVRRSEVAGVYMAGGAGDTGGGGDLEFRLVRPGRTVGETGLAQGERIYVDGAAAAARRAAGGGAWEAR